MKTLETVVLRYHIKDRLIFQNYAEFFRLAGIYVWEYLEEYHIDDTDEMDFDDAFVFDITKETLQLPIDERYKWSRLFFILENSFIAEQNNVNAKRNVDELLEAFACLNNIYKPQENDQYNGLLQAAATLQYFRVNDTKVLCAARMFEEAGEKLRTDSDVRHVESNRHIRYALLYCKQKANLGRWLCKQPLLVLADVLADECVELLKDFPDFSNVWVLRGLVYEISEKHTKEAVESFNQAAIQVGKYPFASSIYYWIGKRCEVYRDIERATMTDDAYRIGHRLDPKYRISYKVAAMCERLFQWNNVDWYYKDCMDYVSQKKYQDPLEQEYFYKAAIRAAYNCLAHLEDVEHAIELLKKAETLRKNIENEKNNGNNEFTKYYMELYGEKAYSDYVELQLKRMGTLQLYQYLSKAYQILGKQQEAMAYSDKFEEELKKMKKEKRE